MEVIDDNRAEPVVEPICRVLDRPRAADRLVNPLRRPQPSALAASFTALPQQPRKTIHL